MPQQLTTEDRDRASIRLVGWLAASWAMLLVVGFFMLRDPDALGASNRVAVDRAAFLSVNVGSLAGFRMDFASPNDFAAPVKAVFVIQTLSGIFLSLIGGGVLLARLLERPYSDSQLTWTALAMMAIAYAVGMFAGGQSNGAAGGFRGLCALGNGGLLFGRPPQAGPALSLVLVPLSVIGSFGVVVVRDTYEAFRNKTALPDYVWRVLVVTAGLYAAAMAALLLADSPAVGNWRETLLRNDALTWAARCWGEATLFKSAWPDSLTFITIAVMLTGVGAAGSAGSIGFAWLLTMPTRLRPMVMNALTAQTVLAAATLAAFVAFEPTLTPVRRTLIVASGVMNLGLSHQPLSLTGVGLFVLAACVAIAKVLPLVVLALAVRKKDLT